MPIGFFRRGGGGGGGGGGPTVMHDHMGMTRGRGGAPPVDSAEAFAMV